MRHPNFRIAFMYLSPLAWKQSLVILLFLMQSIKKFCMKTTCGVFYWFWWHILWDDRQKLSIFLYQSPDPQTRPRSSSSPNMPTRPMKQTSPVSRARVFFFFLAATKQLFCPSVRLSIRPSVCYTFFHNVPVIISSGDFQELLPLTKAMSMEKVKVRGQRSRSQRSKPNLIVFGAKLQFEFTYDDEMMHRN